LVALALDEKHKICYNREVFKFYGLEWLNGGAGMFNLKSGLNGMGFLFAFFAIVAAMGWAVGLAENTRSYNLAAAAVGEHSIARIDNELTESGRVIQRVYALDASGHLQYLTGVNIDTVDRSPFPANAKSVRIEVRKWSWSEILNHPFRTGGRYNFMKVSTT
jgi:hypothetical protein